MTPQGCNVGSLFTGRLELELDDRKGARRASYSFFVLFILLMSTLTVYL